MKEKIIEILGKYGNDCPSCGSNDLNEAFFEKVAMELLDLESLKEEKECTCNGENYHRPSCALAGDRIEKQDKDKREGEKK